VKRLSTIAAFVIEVAAGCQARQTAQRATQDSLVADLARDSSIIEQADRAPDTPALSRMLDRIGIPFQERLANTDVDCLVRGKQAISSFSVSCRICDGAEPLRLHVVADSSGYDELQVLDGGQIAQRIDLAEFERPDSAAAALYAEDLDGDGAREVIMQRFAGATGNTGFTVWRSDLAGPRLVEDSAMSQMSDLVRFPGRPCIYQSWNTSAYDHVSVIECYLDKKWKAVWETSTVWLRTSNAVARELKLMVGDTLRVIRADTVPNPD
jgi:hypothetical protein